MPSGGLRYGPGSFPPCDFKDGPSGGIAKCPSAAGGGDAIVSDHATDDGVAAFAVNLRSEAAADHVYAQITAAGIGVDILVNNAGLGRHGKFREIPVEDDISMIRLNIEAGVRLTKRFLPAVLANRRGRILNTVSAAGWEPGPTRAVYQATKAFVLSWSAAPATELEGTGVTLTALCHGPVDTDFFTKAEMIDIRVFQEAKVMAPRRPRCLCVVRPRRAGEGALRRHESCPSSGSGLGAVRRASRRGHPVGGVRPRAGPWMRKLFRPPPPSGP
ncbi:MAG TPA: SDR family NAD(P)-dependent oxidoreductase [Rariglobus sp.]